MFSLFMAHSASASPADKRLTILGIPIDDRPLKEIGGLFDRWLGDGRQHYVVTPNPEMLVASSHDEYLHAALSGAGLSLADGVGVQLAGWWYRHPIRNRISGVDVARELLGHAARLQASVYFLGGNPGVAQLAAKRLAHQIPKLAIAGASNGGVIQNPEWVDHGILDAIRQTNAAILIVAFGHGTQERFIAAHLARLPSVRIAIGVGGAFDYWSGKIRRAPLLLRQVGLEWLYRLVRQPKRLPRILRAVMVFPYLLVRARYARGKN